MVTSFKPCRSWNLNAQPPVSCQFERGHAGMHESEQQRDGSTWSWPPLVVALAWRLVALVRRRKATE